MKRKKLSQEEIEFIREMFIWFEKRAYEQYFIETPKWKDWLVEQLYKKFWDEGKNVKKESIRRNLNRMIAYYTGQSKQARSGIKYLPYIYEIIDEWKEQLELKGIRAKEFITVEEMEILGYAPHRDNFLNYILVSVPDRKSLTIVVYRLPSEGIGIIY